MDDPTDPAADDVAAHLDPRRAFVRVWNGVGPPGRLMVGRVTGSRSYGTERPHSDWDWAGVYVAPTVRVLALDPPEDTVSDTKGGGVDYTFHEARKFAQVLRTANANAIEALFSPPDCLFPGDADLVAFWDELVAHRREFLTEDVMTHYLAFAGAQLKRVRGEPVRESKKRPNKPVDRMKDAGHGVRLLYNARDVASGREPSVRLDGAERSTVKSIMAGHVGADAVVELAAALTAEIDGLKPWPVAAAFPLAFVNDWLARLRGVHPSFV